MSGASGEATVDHLNFPLGFLFFYKAQNLGIRPKGLVQFIYQYAVHFDLPNSCCCIKGRSGLQI